MVTQVNCVGILDQSIGTSTKYVYSQKPKGVLPRSAPDATFAFWSFNEISINIRVLTNGFSIFRSDYISAV